MAFFLKYAQLLMQEKDPEKQGYYACTLAYSRGVQEVFAAERMQLQGLEADSARELGLRRQPH